MNYIVIYGKHAAGRLNKVPFTHPYNAKAFMNRKLAQGYKYVEMIKVKADYMSMI